MAGDAAFPRDPDKSFSVSIPLPLRQFKKIPSQSSSPRASFEKFAPWTQQPSLLEEPCNFLYNNQQNTLQFGGLGLVGPGRVLALPKGHCWDQLGVTWGVTERICVPWALLSTQWKRPGSRHGSLHFHQNLSQSHDWLWLLNWTRLDSYSEMSNGKMYQQPGSLSNISTYLRNWGFEESILHQLIPEVLDQGLQRHHTSYK